jgi:hypothetical protein
MLRKSLIYVDLQSHSTVLNLVEAVHYSSLAVVGCWEKR